ncbi:MAG: ABC transporter permease [Victivallales bacterium]|jgi:ABC-2 type transport system permease protein|nr:ABC transporter permease [Victivallales bacterium]
MMRDALALYWRYVRLSLKSQLEYRASFLMLALGNFLASGMEIVAIWALFARFRTLKGWTLAEVALFYGIVHVAFALAEAFGRGFDTFDRQVKSGDFDRLLLRPRSLVLQVAAGEVQLMRIGRLSQGLVVLVWAFCHLSEPVGLRQIILAGLAIGGGAALFTGLFVLQATLSFWTTESLEVMNTVTYGGTETAQYPLTIYRLWFRRFFTFVVPLACVSYLPILGILRPLETAAWVPFVAPLAGIVFLLVALRVWRIGVRHYRSTGS